MYSQDEATVQTYLYKNQDETVSIPNSGKYALAVIGLGMLLIAGCASNNKDETSWQQDKESIQSQLMQIGSSQTTLAEQLQALSKQLAQLEARMIPHQESQAESLEQGKTRLFDSKKNIKAKKRTTTTIPRSSATRKPKPQKMSKARKEPVDTIKEKTPPPSSQAPMASGEEMTSKTPPPSNQAPVASGEEMTSKTPPPSNQAPVASGEEMTSKTPPPSSQASVASNKEIKSTYINAYLALKSGRYEHAAREFNNFLAKYPASKYTHQAEFWLGETLHAQGHTAQAIETFRNVANVPEKNPKWNASLLRLGQLYMELGRSDEAGETFQRLIKQRPQSTEAETARKILASIGNNTTM